MPHRVDRIPRYETEFVDSYAGPDGELIQDLTVDELVLQNNTRGGVRFAKKVDLQALEARVSQLLLGSASLFNVKNFGAVGDGNTDDTAAIQAAIDAAGDEGGGVVLLPQGTYLQYANIVLRDKVSIIGLGFVELKRMSHNWGIMFSLSIPANAPNGDNLYQGLSNIIIRNIKFNCNGVAIDRPHNEGGCEAIAMGLSSNIIIDNCEFWNRVGTHTIEISGCRNVLVRACRFYGAYEHVEAGGTPPGDREHIQIEYSIGGAVVRNSHIPLAYAHSENITIESCRFGPSEELPAGAAFVGCHNAIEDDFSGVNVAILDCHFDSPERWAVAWYVSKDYVVDGCTFLNCPMAVRVVCVRNNVDRNGVFLGHGKAPDGLLFTNNYIEGSVDSSYLYYTRTDTPDEPDVRIRNVIIANNIFIIKGTGGIALRFHYDPIIANNVFRGEYTLVLSVLLSSVLFRGNYCNGFKKNGVFCGEDGRTDSGISRNVVVEGNMFVGDHSVESGRAVNLIGNGDNTGATILNNVIRSAYNSNSFTPPLQVKDWDYVSIHGNTIYRVNGFPDDSSWISGIGAATHATIGMNTLLPVPDDPNAALQGVGFRPEREAAVTGNLFVRASGLKASGIKIYGSSLTNDCLALAGVRIKDDVAHLNFGTEDTFADTRRHIMQVGYDYGDSDPYVRPVGTNDRVNLGTPAHGWLNVYVQHNVETVSDARLKEDVRPVDDAVLDAWGDVELREFLLINRSRKEGDIARYHAGVIAQQVQEVLQAKGVEPSSLGFFCHDIWEDGDQYSIRYEELLIIEAAYLRREIQQLKARVAELEKERGKGDTM